MIVKFFDYPRLIPNILKTMSNLKNSIKGSYTSNELVNLRKFKKVFRYSRCSGCIDGTNALILSLIALDISHGDEVARSHTYIATASAVKFVGANLSCVNAMNTFHLQMI